MDDVRSEAAQYCEKLFVSAEIAAIPLTQLIYLYVVLLDAL
jgi:hypothetical protein